MRIEKITFQQTFPTGQFQNQKLGMEVVFDREDDVNVEESFRKMKDEVGKAFEKLNPQINWNENVDATDLRKPIQEKPIRDTVDNIIEDINSCKDEIVLKSYQLIAKKDERIMNAYNEKLKSFQSQ